LAKACFLNRRLRPRRQVTAQQTNADLQMHRALAGNEFLFVAVAGE
jgi:hypothetical protein